MMIRAAVVVAVLWFSGVARAAEAPTSDAKADFWAAFHANRYLALPGVIESLTRAYLRNPRDGELALLLGHAHLWRVSESERASKHEASIINELVLSRAFFEQAKRLTPADARIDGWLATTELALASIYADPALGEGGKKRLAHAVAAYPEFNGFTAAFISAHPGAKPAVQERALAQMWLNVEGCVGGPISRTHPDLELYLKLETHSGAKRVCWNSEKAPHNFEGFALFFGDLASMAGNAALARDWYRNAKRSPTYDRWPYANVLEARLRDVEPRTRRFMGPDGEAPRPEVMSDSSYSCAGCHASSKPTPGL